MPQLDPSTYVSQLVWLALTFIPLFVILWRVALPKVGAAIEARRAHIEADLDRAAALRDEASKVLAAYEKSLAGAHEKARAELRKVADEMAAEAAQRHAALGAKLAEEVAAAERLIGVKVSGPMLEQAVGAAIGEKR